MRAFMKQKFEYYLEETKLKLSYSYKGHKFNVVILTIAAIILSRLLMYLVFMVSSNFSGSNDFIHSMNIWDAGWYESIIKGGYNLYPTGNERGDAANWAFFPLYPLIIRGIHYIVPIDIPLIGSIVSTIFFIAALVVSYIYIVETRNDKKQGLFFIGIMSFGIYSFYFSILYTEALYLFLLVLALHFLHKEKYILVGIVGALLSATRNMGVMLVFAVLVQYTIKYLKNENKSFKGYIVTALKDTNLIFGTLLIPFGLFAYMTYLGKFMGDPMAFAHVQIAWDRTLSNPISNIAHELSKGYRSSLYLAVGSIFPIVCAIWLAIEKRWIEFILAFIFIIIPLMTGLQSVPRYAIGSFVYIVSFIDILKKINKHWLWVAIIIISSLTEILLLIKWFGDNSGVLC